MKINKKIIYGLITLGCTLSFMLSSFSAAYTPSEGTTNTSEKPNIQIDRKGQPLAEQMRKTFSKMDLGQFPSGILLDQGSVLFTEKVVQSNGYPQDNPVSLSSVHFMEAYGDLVRSSITEQLPPYEQLKEKTQQMLEQQHMTPLALAMVSYDAIDAEAYTDGRMTFDGEYFYEPKDGVSFFQTKTFFGAAALTPTVYGPEVEFIIPSELVITNTPAPVRFDDLQITFIDNGAPLGIRIDQPFKIHEFTTDKEGNVHFSLSGLANGHAFITYGSFSYAPLTMPMYYDLTPVTASIPYSGAYGKINVRVYPSLGSVTVYNGGISVDLKNMMIVVDGFDVTNTRTQSTIWADFGSGMQQFIDMGFDLISIDYTQGNDYIQRNGLAIRELLKKIPDWMAPGYENKKAVIMAGSMGTQTARYALRTAEQVYEDHHVGLFVALDGPFKGANIPVGLQWGVEFLAGESAEAQQLLNGLNSIASRQMLMLRINYAPDPLYYSYYNEANQLGLPKKCRNVAVASGSGIGKRLSQQWWVEFAYLNEFNWLGFGVGFKVISDNNGLLFWGKIAELFSTKEWTVTLNSGAKLVDLAPGGTRYSAQELVDTWNANAPSGYGGMTYQLGYHCFIPTYSALAIDTTNINYAPAYDTSLYSKTAFNNVYYEPVNSVEHVSETADNMVFIKNELNGFMATQQSGYLAYTDDGIYKIQESGSFIRKYWQNNQWNTQTIPSWGGVLMQGSLIPGFPEDSNKNVYGVNKNGKVFTTWKNNGVITFATINGVSIAPGSLVLGKSMTSGDMTAPGVYGTHGNGYGYGVINFYYKNGGWNARMSNGGYLIPGSLVYGNDVIYGVDSTGCLCMIRQENGNLKHYKILETYKDIVPGSLCFGYSMWSGDGTSPGLYAVTRGGDVVNYRWINNAWNRRTTNWGKAVSGSLVLCGTEVYGVNPQGIVCLIRQENSNLKYYQIMDNHKDVVPGSLCFGDSWWSGDNHAPGLYALTTAGKIVNYRYINSAWNRRTTSWGGDAIVGSLILGGTKIFGVDSQDHIVAAWQQSGALTYSILPN